MFSSVIHDYIHTIIDTKYTKRTKSAAIKYCDEVINEFLIVFSTQNPEIMKYLNDQTYAEYKPVNPIFKVSLYIDLFKPTVQNWVKSILLEKNVNERLLKTPIVTKITRLIYDNLFGKQHPASKFSVIDSSKATPIIEAVEYNDSEENLVNACQNETFRLLEYKSKIETNEITKFACLLHIEEHEEEFELMKNYTRHIIELIVDDIIAWSNKHTTSSKTRTKRTFKTTVPILQEEQEEQEEINPVNEEIRSIVEKIPTTTNISIPQPPLSSSVKHNRKQQQLIPPTPPQQQLIPPTPPQQQQLIPPTPPQQQLIPPTPPQQQLIPPTLLVPSRRKITTTPNVQTMKHQPNNCIPPQLPIIDIPKIPDDDNIYPGMIDEDAYADFGGSDDESEEDAYREN